MTRFLIVDDNEQSLYMLQYLLKSDGHEVVTAANGAEALEKARQDPPDMIITDILMPVMDGFALCREWKEDKRLKGIPLVFYTATYTDPKDRELGLSLLGADRFIVKPAEPDVFVEMLREVLEEEAGRLVTPREPVAEEAVYFRMYNEALIRKLEDKMLQLEKTNQALERDIAKRKKAEEALREERALLARRVAERTADLSAANAELARVARAKDDFLASMSHELRTPLNAILGLSEALQEMLVDQPNVVRNVLRVSGPFTVEGVQPAEETLDLESPIGGEPEELDTFAAPAEEPANAEAYLE